MQRGKNWYKPEFLSVSKKNKKTISAQVSNWFIKIWQTAFVHYGLH